MRHVPKPESIDDTPLPARRRTIDAHVHPWPERLYAAVTGWFDRNAWPIAERVPGGDVDGFLGERGIDRYVAMVYAHKPRMAADLNRWMAAYQARHPAAIALGTVHPADDVHAVVSEALGPMGLAGLKLHTHVMGLPVDDTRLYPAYELLCETDRPLVVHAGTAPASPAYPRPCHEVSGLARLAKVLAKFPRLRCLVPHMGAGEFELAGELLARYPNLHLDTAMVLARYFPEAPARDFVAAHSARILYGTDFPILPYPYDRERRCILALALGAEAEEAIFWRNAARFFGVEPDAPLPAGRG